MKTNYEIKLFDKQKLVKLNDLKPLDIIVESDLFDCDEEKNFIYLTHSLTPKNKLFKVLEITVLTPNNKIETTKTLVHSVDNYSFVVVGKAFEKANNNEEELTK